MQLSEPSQINQLLNHRPVCAKCGAMMTLARLEPTSEPGYENRTFECPACGNIHSPALSF